MSYHQAESRRPSILRRCLRAQASQKCTRRPFSTEQIQVSGRPSAVAPQRPHAVREGGDGVEVVAGGVVVVLDGAPVVVV